MMSPPCPLAWKSLIPRVRVHQAGNAQHAQRAAFRDARAGGPGTRGGLGWVAGGASADGDFPEREGGQPLATSPPRPGSGAAQASSATARPWPCWLRSVGVHHSGGLPRSTQPGDRSRRQEGRADGRDLTTHDLPNTFTSHLIVGVDLDPVRVARIARPLERCGHVERLMRRSSTSTRRCIARRRARGFPVHAQRAGLRRRTQPLRPRRASQAESRACDSRRATTSTFTLRSHPHDAATTSSRRASSMSTVDELLTCDLVARPRLPVTLPRLCYGVFDPSAWVYAFCRRSETGSRLERDRRERKPNESSSGSRGLFSTRRTLRWRPRARREAGRRQRRSGSQKAGRASGRDGTRALTAASRISRRSRTSRRARALWR